MILKIQVIISNKKIYFNSITYCGCYY